MVDLVCLKHKWTTKAYDFTCDEPIPFPEPLRKKCSEIVANVPWGDLFQDDDQDGDWRRWQHDYGWLGFLMPADFPEPDTGIVNFYQVKDTLMGHVDRAEYVTNVPNTN